MAKVLKEIRCVILKCDPNDKNSYGSCELNYVISDDDLDLSKDKSVIKVLTSDNLDNAEALFDALKDIIESDEGL